MLAFGVLDSTAPRLIDQHWDGLGFGWRRREDRLSTPACDFAALCEHDDHMLAAEEALRVLHGSGPHVSQHVQRLLKHPLRRAELFSLTVHALNAQDPTLVGHGLDLSIALPDLRDAFDAALAWVAPSPLLARTVEALPVARRLPLVAQRLRDLPDQARQAMEALTRLPEDPDALAASLTLARQAGMTNTASGMLPHLTHPHPNVRLRAAQLGSMLGAPESGARVAALQTLRELALADDTRLAPAIRAAAARTLCLHDPAHGRELWAPLSALSPPLAIECLGWIGDVAAVPLLMKALHHDELARSAAQALSLITGADPHYDGWLGDRPATATPHGEPATDATTAADAMPDEDAQALLPWPDPDGFSAWWAPRQDRFDPQVRWFAGQPVDAAILRDVLHRGPLPWRPLAAEHLQHLHRSAWFPTDAPAHRQRAWLAGLPA